MKVLTIGCWDLLHLGHIRHLYAVKALGDHLTVGVYSDEVIATYKSKPPIITLNDRVDLLKALSCVNSIVPIHYRYGIELVRHVKPDILVVGKDQGIYNDFDVRVIELPYTKGISTSIIINKIRESINVEQ